MGRKHSATIPGVRPSADHAETARLVGGLRRTDPDERGGRLRPIGVVEA